MNDFRLKLFIFILTLTSLELFAAGGSMSKSCSGVARHCDEYGICTDEYFYLHAYQYAKFKRNGELEKHNHRFNFRGLLLGDEGDYIFNGEYTEKHLIYTGILFDLAIPWDKNFAIYRIQHKTGEIEVLCP